MSLTSLTAAVRVLRSSTTHAPTEVNRTILATTTGSIPTMSIVKSRGDIHYSGRGDTVAVVKERVECVFRSDEK